MWTLKQIGGRWLAKVTLKLLLVLLVVSMAFFRHKEFPAMVVRPRPAGRSKPRPAVCSSLYRLSSVSYRLEKAPPAVSGCLPPRLDPPLLRRCMSERARRRRRRPTSILLLGDSRLRILYNHMADELDLPVPPENKSLDKDWQKGIRWDNSPERWCAVCPWYCCPRAAISAEVSLRFEWRPFWTEAMVTEIEEAAERCKRGHDDCPDLVVVNGALWYSRRLHRPNEVVNITEMALLLRLQLGRAAAALARLAALTRTVWKLDEEQLYDMRNPMLHRSSLPEIPVLHSVVFEAAKKIPGLVVWTSALPESTGFLRQKCYPFIDSRHWTHLFNDVFIDECGDDSIHASKVVMSDATQMLFADMCRSYLNLALLGAGAKNRTLDTRKAVCCSEDVLSYVDVTSGVEGGA